MSDVLDYKGDLSSINVLPYLSEQSGLRGLTVYGRVSRAVEAEGYLSSLVLTRGFYVLVEVIGFESREPLLANENLYTTLGSVVAVADDPSVIGEWVKVANPYNKHVTMRCGEKSGNNRFNSVNILNFRRSRDGRWEVSPNAFTILRKGTATSSLEDMVTRLRDLQFVSESKSLLTSDKTRVFHGLPPEITYTNTDIKIPEKRVEEEIPEVVTEAYRVPSTTGARLSFSDTKTSDMPPGSLLSRLSIEPLFEGLDAIRAEVNRCSLARQEFINDFPLDSGITVWRSNAVIKGFERAVLANYSGSMGFGTGRIQNEELLDQFLSKIYPAGYGKLAQIKASLIDDPSDIALSDTPYPELNNPNIVFLAILDVIMEGNLTKKFLKPNTSLPSNIVDYIVMNPYFAGLLIGWDVADADKAYFMLAGMGTADWVLPDQHSFTRYRNVLIGLTRAFDASNESTLIPTRSLFEGAEIPRYLKYIIKQYGVPFNDTTSDLLNNMYRVIYRQLTKAPITKGYNDLAMGVSSPGCYMSEEVTPTSIPGYGNVTYASMGWNKSSDRFLMTAGSSVYQDLDENGLAVTVGDSIIAAVSLEMELGIYEMTHSMGSRPTGVPQESIDEAISEYEAEKGFPLEELQRNGVELLKFASGCLTGPAGSGKTTVSEVFVKALKKSLPEYDLAFAAPTGKAARRMKEVLGDLGDVKTIHSLFQLNTDRQSAVYVPNSNHTQANMAYFIDEMAMCTIDVLYRVLLNVGPTSLIYYFGDIQQLPPIGKGMPFRDMLNYMPSVELGVSKRAKDGSGINLNCDLINKNSTRAAYRPLEPKNDFILVPANDRDIVDKVLAGVKNNITKMNPDDIQVATPYATETKAYSSYNLNTQLQDIFLPTEDVLYTLRNGDRRTAFKLGARTIHVKKNMYGKLKYRWDGKNNLVMLPASGVVNGEMGKLVGLIPAQTATFHKDDDYLKILETRGIEPLADWDLGKRDVDKKFFAIVEVYDPDIKDFCHVVYKGTDTGSGYSDFEGQNLRGGELPLLELGYALTVHKLQGSQASMIVIPLGSKDRESFVTRNMLYTAVSRAIDKVVLVGSVTGTGSMVDRARSHTTVMNVKTMLSIMAGTMEL